VTAVANTPSCGGGAGRAGDRHPLRQVWNNIDAKVVYATAYNGAVETLRASGIDAAAAAADTHRRPEE
jgi:hypothetical protein